jgi:hypothetical protein
MNRMAETVDIRHVHRIRTGVPPPVVTASQSDTDNQKSGFRV